MRVLVIDDEEIILESVRKVLTGENYEVDTAISSREGLRLALERDYDLVLTDIRMPEIGGMRILRDIKRAKPSLPVIIFTGYATVKPAVQAMQLGATNYIEKPFTPDVLVNAVRVGLKAGKSTRPETQEIVHASEILAVLERTAHDSDFVSRLYYEGADAQKRWLEQRLNAEIW